MVKYSRSRNVKRSKKKSRRTYRTSNMRRSYRRSNPRRNSRNVRRSSATKKKSRRTYRRRNLKGGTEAAWTDEELRVLAVVVDVVDADDGWRRKDGLAVDGTRVGRITEAWNKSKAYSERSEESVREAMAQPAPTSPPDWSLSDTAALDRGDLASVSDQGLRAAGLK